MTIGNTCKDCQKLQYFISGISIATVYFQELGNGECITYAQATSKLWCGVTPFQIYFIYSLIRELKNIIPLHAALNNYANKLGFTWNIKVKLERTRKDNFLLNQRVILHYMKSRFTQVPLSSLSMINFWWSCFSHPEAVFDPGYTHQAQSRHSPAGWHHSLAQPVLIPTKVPDVLLWGVGLSPHPVMLSVWGQQYGLCLRSCPTSP